MIPRAVNDTGIDSASIQRVGIHECSNSTSSPRPLGDAEPPLLSVDHVQQFMRLTLEAWVRARSSYEDPDVTVLPMSPGAQLSLLSPSRLDDTSAVSIDQPRNLDEALMDLYSVRRKAEVEQEVVPSEELVTRADRILRAMHKMDPRRYLVYGMPEGDVVIDADTMRGTKLSVICSDDGPTRCMFYSAGRLRKKQYTDDAELEDDQFLKGGLRGSPQPE